MHHNKYVFTPPESDKNDFCQSFRQKELKMQDQK